jgi:hypothetical protein
LAVERREFVTIVGAALAGWPLAAAAQQSKMPAIGYLQSGTGSVPAAASLLALADEVIE